MPISLSGTRITVTWVSGDAKGNSAVNAYTMDDVMAAGVAQSWPAQITKVGRDYFIPYSLYVLGADTWFTGGNTAAITGGSWRFYPPTPPTDLYLLYVTANMLLGVSSNQNQYGMSISCDPGLHTSKRFMLFQGTSVITNINIEEFYVIYVYSGAVLNRCTLRQNGFNVTTNDTGSIYDLFINGGSYGWQLNGINEANNITIHRTLYGIFSQGIGTALIPTSEATGRNIKLFNTVTSDTRIRCGHGSPVLTYFFIDCNMSPSRLEFYNSGAGEQTVSQKLITTISGTIQNNIGQSLLTITAADESILEEITLTNGVIPETEVIYFEKFRTVAAGATVTEGETTYEPFKVTVTKEGYQDLTISDIMVTPGEPTIIRGELVEVEPPIYYHQALKGVITCPTLKGSIKVQRIKGTIKTC